MIHCDLVLCVGCTMCEVACSSFHFGAVSPGLSRIRVAKLEDKGIDMAIACLSCAEKPCLDCPTDALCVGENGLICLDEGLCIACLACVENCPVGAVGFDENEPLFCDLCDGATSCVTACPSGALTFREEHREVPLEAFMTSSGRPNQKRALYVGVQAEPIREGWKNGARIDS